jgi:hypothetical protein
LRDGSRRSWVNGRPDRCGALAFARGRNGCDGQGGGALKIEINLAPLCSALMMPAAGQTGLFPVDGELYNHTTRLEPTFMPLSNTEKQARYRERHLGVDGVKVRVGLILNAHTRAQLGRLALHRGYTITAGWSRAPSAGSRESSQAKR